MEKNFKSWRRRKVEYWCVYPYSATFNVFVYFMCATENFKPYDVKMVLMCNLKETIVMAGLEATIALASISSIGEV